MNRAIIYQLILTLLISIPIHAFGGAAWSPQPIEIYQNPMAEDFGASLMHTARPLRYYTHRFISTLSRSVIEHDGFLTASIVTNEVAQNLHNLFREDPNLPASHSLLRTPGYYNSLSFQRRHLHRLTQHFGYNEFHHQVASLLPHVHYLYIDEELGINIEFSLERPSEAMLTSITHFHQDDPEMANNLIDYYNNHWVLRIHRTKLTNSAHHYPTMEDIMFASTLLGATHQPWQAIPSGNNHLENIYNYFRNHPLMGIYLNQDQSERLFQ